LDKVFKLKLIKKGGKSLFQQFKTFIRTFKSNIFSNHQQQLYNHLHSFKSLHLKEVKQHEESVSNEEKIKQLEKIISQDIKRNQNDD